MNTSYAWFMPAMLALMFAGKAGAAQEPGLTFYLPFESNAIAAVARGDPAPLDQPQPSRPGELVEGILGRGMQFQKGQILWYNTAGNFDFDRGSLSFWFKCVAVPEKIGPGEQNYFFKGADYPMLRLFLFGSRYIFYDGFSSRIWNIAKFEQQTSLGAWNHLVWARDKDVGECFYLNGRFVPPSNANNRFYHQAATQAVMRLMGLENPGYTLVLDEFKIHDRMLNAAEAAAEYRALFPLAMQAGSVVCHAGVPGTVTLRLTNKGQEPVKGILEYAIIRGGQEEARGKRENLAVAPGQTLEEAVPFTPAEAGEYRLNLAFRARSVMTSAQNLYALAKAGPAVKLDEHPELKLKLVKEFDCTREYGPEEYCDDGMCKVVQGPAGKYRETGSEKPYSRFAYRFEVDEPEQPFLAVIEYPDDKDRILEVMIDNKGTAGGTQTMENGLIIGGEFPNSGKMKEVRYLFYPQMDKECTIQVMAWPIREDKFKGTYTPVPAACRSIKIYKVLNAHLPPVKFNNLPPKDKQRVIGYEEENGTIDVSLFRVPLRPHEEPRYEDIYKILDRWTDYSRFVGLNLFTFPLIHYNGALYPSEVYAKSEGFTAPDYWVDQALDLCAQKDIKFYAGICYWTDPVLHNAVMQGPDVKGVARGEDTVRQVSWNGDIVSAKFGRNPAYDILNPKVEQRILAMVQDLMDTYGGHPAFGGLTFWCGPYASLWFGDLEWGYSDRDIALFEKETGIKVEMKNEECKIKNAEPGGQDPQRFLKRYLFLVRGAPEMKEQWIAWRCQKVKELWMKIAAIVRKQNPAFKLAIYPSYGKVNLFEIWRPGDLQCLSQYYRGGGLDLEQFQQIPNLLVGKGLRPNCVYRGDEGWHGQDFNAYARENIAPFRSPNGNAVWIMQDRWEFDNLPAQPLTNYWWKDEKGREIVPKHKSGGIVPHGDFFIASYANVLADFDAWYISDGGITVTELGHEDDLREFARAYRTLPAEHFAVFRNTDDPLCVRFRERDDGTYFYAVSRVPYPLQVQLAFNAAESFKLLDLPADREFKVKGALDLELAPFRVRTFRAPKGVLLKEVQVEAPPAEIEKLKQRVDAYHEVLRRLKAQNIQLDRRSRAEEAWLTAEVERAWAEKRYARVGHLLDGYHAKKLKRILTDPQLRSYLAVPDEYTERYLAPAKVMVRKVSAIPGLAASAWQDYTITDVFAEVMRIEGRCRPRPAADKTVVAACYDGAALGFFFHCYDREVEKVHAKEVKRDGSVIARDDDSVELFLAHAERNEPYYHFLANYGKSIKDRKVPEDAAWYNPDWTIETRKEKNGWVARIVIPFKALEKTPVSGEVWGLNLCRNMREVNAAFRCDDRGFHCPDHFAELKFE